MIENTNEVNYVIKEKRSMDTGPLGRTKADLDWEKQVAAVYTVHCIVYRSPDSNILGRKLWLDFNR